MNDQTLLGPWVRRFRLEHLAAERNLARNTQRRYRDALMLLVPLVAGKTRRPVDRLQVVDVSADPYPDKPQMDALLAAPDRETAQGRRDHTLLLFLYNSGARAAQAAQLLVGELALAGGSVKIRGKGGKQRHCPLWPSTIAEFTALIADRSPTTPVFLNRCGHPTTRFGIHKLVERYVRKAQIQMPSLATKRISPHTIRHTTAKHLLRAGVDINTVRAWLGHVSLDTTNIYAEIDLETKAKALAQCEVGDAREPKPRWRDNPGLMAFLRSL